MDYGIEFPDGTVVGMGKYREALAGVISAQRWHDRGLTPAQLEAHMIVRRATPQDSWEHFEPGHDELTNVLAATIPVSDED